MHDDCSMFIKNRYYATMKNIFRAHWGAHVHEEDQRIPFVLFVARESKQESLRFNSLKLFFGHPVRGPLIMIKEQWVDENPMPIDLEEYVSKMRRALDETQ